MAQATVNPYGEIGGYIPTGLASIIASATTPPSIDTFVGYVYAYVQPIFYPAGGGSVSAQVEIEIKSIARTAINSYINNLVMGGQAGYNGNQFAFIMKLIGSQMTANLPIISINDRIGNVEDLISESGLTVSEQTPLLFATTVGTNAYTYWSGDILGGSPAWAGYYPPAPEDYMDLAYYVEAAMIGALAGYGATPAGMVEPSVNFVSTKMIAALIGALTVTAGKVIYKWIPRIQPASMAGGMMGLNMAGLGIGGGFPGGGGNFGINIGPNNDHSVKNVDGRVRWHIGSTQQSQIGLVTGNGTLYLCALCAYNSEDAWVAGGNE